MVSKGLDPLVKLDDRLVFLLKGFVWQVELFHKVSVFLLYRGDTFRNVLYVHVKGFGKFVAGCFDVDRIFNLFFLPEEVIDGSS